MLLLFDPLVGDSSPLMDPIQCAGDPSKSSGQSQGAPVGGHKRGNAHHGGILFGDQGAAGIAKASGSAAGRTGAQDLIGDGGGSVEGDTLVVGHYLKVDALQRIGESIAEGGHSPSTDICPPVLVALGSISQ